MSRITDSENSGVTSENLLTETAENYECTGVFAGENNYHDGCRYINAASCPDCGAGMVRQGFCFSCPVCGFGSCSI